MNSIEIKVDKFDSINRQRIAELISIHDGIYVNDPASNMWKFKNFSANFDSIFYLKTNFQSWVNLLDFDLIEFAKLLFLFSIQNIKGSTIIRYRFDSIVKTLHFCAASNLYRIDNETLIPYIKFMLSRGLHQAKLVERSTPLSWANFKCGLLPLDWFHMCRKLNLSFTLFQMAEEKESLKKALSIAISEISSGDLSVGDWKVGGSFNSLTLDYGQYYVDHCINFFDDNIFVAISIKKTIAEALNFEITKKAGMAVSKDSLKSYVMLLISHFLAGKKVEDLSKVTLKRNSITWFRNIRNETIKALHINLFPLAAIHAIRSDPIFSELLRKLSINSDDSKAIESVRSILNTYILRKYVFERNEAASLLLEDLDNLQIYKCYSEVINAIECLFSDLLERKICPEINESFFLSRGIREFGTQSKYALNFVKMVEDAGIIKFVALTGWRESEFGFSIRDLTVSKNIDAIDRFLMPSKFTVNGEIPKTHGKAKLNREISREQFYSALLLSKLVQADVEEPCLYSFNTVPKILVIPVNLSNVLSGIFGQIFFSTIPHFKKLET